MLRDRASGGHARVTYVELFFDLGFVFAVTQLSHGLMAHPTLLGVVETGLLLMAVWWAWIFTAWVTNWLDPERAPVRIMLFVAMVVGMVMTMSIPKAFGDRGLVFALAFVAIQLGRSLFTAWAMRDHPFQSRNFIRISVWFATSGVLWITGGLAEGGARLALWGGALALEYVSPALDDPGRDVPDPVDVLQDPAVFLEEPAIGDEVALDPGEGDGEVLFIELRGPRLGAAQRDRVALPLAPGAGRLGLDAAVGMGQALVVGGDQVAALLDRDWGQEPLPGVGEKHRGAVLVEPAQFLLGQQEDAA
jgi:hypothetical protein